MSAVEQILSAAARSTGPVPTSDGKAVADRAVWFCACVTHEEAPAWLIYDTTDGNLGWCRVPSGRDVGDVVDAPLVTGDHVDPEEVLRWLLQDQNTDWVPGDALADKVAIQEVGRRIRGLQ